MLANDHGQHSREAVMLPRRKPTKAIMGTRKDSGPLRCEPHLEWIRKSCGCIVPGCWARKIRACHVRYGLPPGEPKGTNMKPGDQWTYPACDPHHAEEHRGVETFQRKYGLILAEEARKYAAASPALHRLRMKMEREQ